MTLLRSIVEMQVLVDALKANDPKIYDEEQTVWREVTEARISRITIISAFASKEVFDALTTYEDAWDDVYKALHAASLETEESRTAAADAMLAAGKPARARLNALTDAIRRDLRNQ
jgi:hypothetical protein